MREQSFSYLTRFERFNSGTEFIESAMLKFDRDHLEFCSIHNSFDDGFLLQIPATENLGDRTSLQPQDFALEFTERLACVSFTPFDLNLVRCQPNLEFGASAQPNKSVDEFLCYPFAATKLEDGSVPF
jgi:hypothetical protein